MRFTLVLLVLLFVPYVHAAEIQTFVNDYADVFTPQEEAQLSAVAKEIYASGQAQYAIVTVRSLDGKPIEDYAIELAQGKLGDTQKDNGLLLLIAVEDREYRFEVGSGLEGMLNDAKVGRIGRAYLVPAFTQGQYGEGTLAASNAVRDIVVTGVEPQAMRSVEQRFDYVLWVGIVFMIIFMVLVFSEKKRKRKKKENDFFEAAVAAAYLFGGRGGGGMGGGGGFGGGGFSGGGSSGGW